MTARSLRGPLAVAVCAVPLLLAACKEEPQVIVQTKVNSTVYTPGEGSSVEKAEDGKALELAADLPQFAPAYPGARLTTQIANEGRTGALLVFETADPVEKVAAFYDAKAKDAGIKPAMVVNEDGSAVRIFGGPSGDDKAGGALIAISKADEGPQTKIVITSGMAKTEVARIEKDRDAWRDAARPAVRLQ
jgi:hypothetical protein